MTGYSDGQSCHSRLCISENAGGEDSGVKADISILLEKYLTGNANKQ